MTIHKSLIAFVLSLGILAAPALTFAHESDASLGSDADIGIGAVHPALASGILFGGDGAVMVRGAKVESVGSTSIAAQSPVGSSLFNWVLNIGSSTKIKKDGMSSTSLADIAVGDTISFRGILNSMGSVFTVDAKAIRDWAHVSTTTASTSVSHENNGKHLGWFKNWFRHLFSVKAHAGVNAQASK